MTAKSAHRKDPHANKAHPEHLVGHHLADFVSAPLLETCLERLELPDKNFANSQLCQKSDQRKTQGALRRRLAFSYRLSVVVLANSQLCEKSACDQPQGVCRPADAFPTLSPVFASPWVLLTFDFKKKKDLKKNLKTFYLRIH
jgi:hypothetical protein